MPELPEVETVRRTLLPLLMRKRILSVDISYAPCVHEDLPSFRNAIEGKKIEGMERKGKFLIFVLEGGIYLLSHLRMEGKYRLESEMDFQKRKHDLLLFHLDSKEILCYNDQRKFGVFLLKNEKTLQSTPPLSLLGKEPFDMDPKALFEGLKRKGGPIKSALLDQSLISGIGNIYADEILWASKIDSFKRAKAISLSECESLLTNAKAILSAAIEKGGSTVRSYHPNDGVDGRMQNELHAYSRGGKPCARCGMPLRKKAIAGRGTTYCPYCQRAEGENLIVGVTGPIASGKSTVSGLLAKRGFLVLDADEMVHSLYSKRGFQRTLGRMFGPNVLKEGKVDRAFILSVVSKDEKKKKELEAAVHKRVFDEFERRIQNEKGKRIALDVPLLIGSPLESLCDAIILVTAPKELQEERLKKRGVDASESLKLNEGFPLERARKECAIEIKTGTGPIESLERKLDAFPFLSDR